MFRKDLLNLLINQPRSLTELAQLLESKPKDIEQDLQHLLRSSKHMGYRALIEPALCRQCAFVFGKDKLHKPGKCPHCKQTWIREPRISFTESAR